MRQEIFIKMVLDAWNEYVKRTDNLFNSLSEEQLLSQVSTGRNSGFYLLGHLTAVHDKMIPLLGLGESLFPALYEPFVQNAEGGHVKEYDTASVRQNWKEVNTALNEKLNQLNTDEWLQKHTAVSEEDFEKEPHRNRLNVIINRTNHLASHYGQLIFLQARKN